MLRTTCLIGLAAVVSAAFAAESPTRAIYRCDTPTGPVFTDRPCEPGSQPYESSGTTLSVMSTVAPTPVASPKPSSVRTVRAEKSASTAKAEACARIEQSLRKIASTMRAGYSASQGERLKERKRDLDEKRRLQRC